MSYGYCIIRVGCSAFASYKAISRSSYKKIGKKLLCYGFCIIKVGFSACEVDKLTFFFKKNILKTF